jgi:hypothetical protein
MRAIIGPAFAPTCLGLTLLVGCTSSDPLNRKANVIGKVTLDGVPLAGGTVMFESANGAYNPQSTIRLDGSYIIQEPPLGDCKITVRTSHLKSFAPPLSMRGKVTAKSHPGYVEEEVGYYTAIPKKYETAETSGLTVTVKPGDMTHDIALVSR